MAFYAPTEAIIHNIATPTYDSVGTVPSVTSTSPQVVNSAWTHPNPFVVQIGNHLFHKDEIPSSLQYNDLKRDKEVLDNLRNKALRRQIQDATPSFARQAVPRPAEATPIAHAIAPGSIADTMTKTNAPAFATISTVTGSIASNFSATLPNPPQGKPYSPLATPCHHSGLPYTAVNAHPAYAAHGFTVVGAAAPMGYTFVGAAPAIPAFTTTTTAPTVVLGNSFPSAYPSTFYPSSGIISSSMAPAVTIGTTSGIAPFSFTMPSAAPITFAAPAPAPTAAPAATVPKP